MGGRRAIGDGLQRAGRRRLACLAMVLMAAALTGCNTIGWYMYSPPKATVPPLFAPGDGPSFGVGYSQDAEYFRHHVVRAQYEYAVNDRDWQMHEIRPGMGQDFDAQIWPCSFRVRWELKDGRKFRVDLISSRSFVDSYRRRSWARESHLAPYDRPAPIEAYSSPILVVEVWEDTAILKWYVPVKRTLAARDLPEASLLPVDPDKFTIQEFVLAKVKGREVTAINFDEAWYFDSFNKAGL